MGKREEPWSTHIPSPYCWRARSLGKGRDLSEVSSKLVAELGWKPRLCSFSITFSFYQLPELQVGKHTFLFFVVFFLRPTSQLKEKQRHYLSWCLHSFPEAKKQDDDHDDQTEQKLPLGQANVMNPTALMQMQDATPAGEDGIIREDDLGLDHRPAPESAHRWRRAQAAPVPAPHHRDLLCAVTACASHCPALASKSSWKTPPPKAVFQTVIEVFNIINISACQVLERWWWINTGKVSVLTG